MTHVRCRQGHPNPQENRFCHLCGEPLAAPAIGVVAGMILGDRYRITCQLGAGGFGRTYLAEDINRFNEPCVLKEFAPQVQGTYALQKSEELFAREAGVLYKLQHLQIPRFRELFRADFGNHGHLFLVQDYVAGKTYRQILDARKMQGVYFTETEVLQLLTQLLPVLHYIHSAGVIHRDISPDNLILRDSDQRPVLIDFGGVKQIAAVAASHYVQPDYGQPEHLPAAPVTRLGKVGYAPVEQMQVGKVFPHSDLYALAVTVLVLLTDRDPQELLGDGTMPQHWQRFVRLNPSFTAVLERMLAMQPIDRYQSAAEVMYALKGTGTDSGAVPTQPPSSYPSSPTATVPAYATGGQTPAYGLGIYSSGGLPATYPPTGHLNSAAVPSAPTPRRQQRKSRGGGVLLVLFLLGVLAGTAWWTQRLWLPLFTNAPPAGSVNGEATNPDTTSTNFSEAEQTRKATLSDRRQTLGINPDFLIQLTDDTFIRRYPDQKGRTLTTAPDDAEWRQRWDAIAAEWLDLLEQLSPAARAKLGNYRQSDREAWKRAANRLYVGSRSLNDLTDARFFYLFPDRRGQEFIDQPIGQVWQAIAADTVKSLQDGTTLERIRFAPDTFNQDVIGTLAPGTGKVYIVNLSAQQIMRLNLQAPRRRTLLSIYLPRPTAQTPFYLEDSPDLTWSGTLTQSGFYEIVVVSTASAPLNYRLSVAVDNVTSTPLEPAKPEVPGAKN